MLNTLYQRHLLRLLDFKEFEIQNLISFAIKLKKDKKNNKEKKYLKNKNIALIFEKESTRTRCAFEVAAFDQGAHVTYLGPSSTHLGYKESIKDTARVLSKMYHGIQYRGHEHSIVETLSDFSNVPVWNGLTETFHPTQVLADLLTIKKEHCDNRKFNQITCAYIGDTRNNISNTMLEASAITGLKLRLVSPKEYWPDKKLFLSCQLQSIEKKMGI